MRRHLFSFVLLSLALGWACAPNSGAASSGKENVIRIKGSNAMAKLVDQWAKAFGAANPGVSVIVAGGGTDMGFEALFEKTAELTMASRQILIKELQAAALSDCRIERVEVCKGVVCVLTHPENPVNDLTLDQLSKSFTGQFKNWQDLGGLDQPLTVIMGQPISGTAEYLRASVMEQDYFTPEAKVRDHYHGMIRELSRKKPPALSYAPLLEALAAEKANAAKILGIKKDANSAAVRPSVESAKDGSYPLVLPLYFYWNAKKAGPAIEKFVQFCKKRCEI